MDRLRSRKFWLALLGALLPIVAALLTGEVDPEVAVKSGSAVLASYILGQGYVDAQAAKLGAPLPEASDADEG